MNRRGETVPGKQIRSQKRLSKETGRSLLESMGRMSKVHLCRSSFVKTEQAPNDEHNEPSGTARDSLRLEAGGDPS